MNDRFVSFADVVFDRASQRPEDIAYRFHTAQEPATIDLSVAEVDRRVRAIASGLQRRNLAGQRVVLALAHSPDFVLSFFGCLAAGAVAVPVPRQRAGKHDARFDAVIANAEPALVLVDAAALDWVREGLAATAATAGRPPPFVTTPDMIAGDPSDYRPPLIDQGCLAVMQYTSGSTGEPKGVMITHGNMLANCRLIQDTLQVDSTSSGVMWLPFYHDMGLVGAVLLPMYVNGCVDLMSPQDFLRAPMSWLEKLSSVRATTTAAPNFALELCCDLATPEIVAGLDLSSLRCLLTGSEPVNPNTLERFAACFAPCGFRFDAFLPAYGLAEATLLATGTLRHGRGPTILSVDARALAESIVQPPEDGGSAMRFVGNGAAKDVARIADPASGQPLGGGEIGEIWLTGPSIAKGYWSRPDLTDEVFGARLEGEPAAGPFYRTGDLGFILDGDLFIAGRLKDLIIVRGRNIHPQDVEEAATRAQELLWTGGAAAFATNLGHGEEVVLVVEAALASVKALRDPQTAAGLAADIVRRIAASHEITLAEVCIIRPGRLPRTSSGKIRRGAAQEEWGRSGFSAGLIHRWTRPVVKPGPAAPLRKDEATLTRRDVENWLLDRIAQLSGQPKHMIDLDEPFASYGLDSVTAIEIIEAINRLSIGGRSVDPVDLYDHPTIARLLDHMFADGGTDGPPDTDEPERDLAREAATLRALLDN